MARAQQNASEVSDFVRTARRRKARESARRSRAQVAESLEWHQCPLAKLEAGTQAPSRDEVLALTRLYTVEGLRTLDRLSNNGQA